MADRCRVRRNGGRADPLVSLCVEPAADAAAIDSKVPVVVDLGNYVRREREPMSSTLQFRLRGSGFDRLVRSVRPTVAGTDLLVTKFGFGAEAMWCDPLSWWSPIARAGLV
jgi:hypothetical protein